MEYAVMTYLFRSEGVLMVEKGKRSNDPNSCSLTLPGGKLNEDEKGMDSPSGRLDAAIRETREETGLEVIASVFSGTILFDNRDRIFPDDSIPSDNFLVYFYQAGTYSGTLRETEEGRPFWFPTRKLFTSPRIPLGDRTIYMFLETSLCLDKLFIGVIKHKGKEVDLENSFVDYFDQP
ncbi:MAG: NUDIX domain-containing protein [Nanoarchaeota archaeon]|nr:NUDIX domain-containing protein [Nanoarchaeota archaeon]